MPHSIRGSIHSFHQFLPTTPSFSHCTACSSKVLELYKRDGFQFLKNVCNNSSYLDEMTGLQHLMTEANLDEVLEFDDDDSVSCPSSS